MKYLIVVPDGAGDNPIEALGNKTPLEVAKMPYINHLAKRGQVGSVVTVPQGIAPGSDAANLSLMGYNPLVYLTGRSPLEAVSIGVDMKETDTSFRGNLITISEGETFVDQTIIDHSSGDISTEEADELLRALREKLANRDFEIFTGTSYRHCILVHSKQESHKLTPPHDILGRNLKDYLPDDDYSKYLVDVMEQSYYILKNHPLNERRKREGKNPANCLWIWGQGMKPKLERYKEKYNLQGTVISAVDLIKGIGMCAQLKAPFIKGATGTVHTDYHAKARVAIEAFESGDDFVYIHLEGPDECSHQGDLEGKIEALENIDEKIVKPVVEALKKSGEDFKILVVPDHRTPLSIRTHSSDPIPYVIYDSRVDEYREENAFCEKAGEKGNFYEEGHKLTDYFLDRNIYDK